MMPAMKTQPACACSWPQVASFGALGFKREFGVQGLGLRVFGSIVRIGLDMSYLGVDFNPLYRG